MASETADDAQLHAAQRRAVVEFARTPRDHRGRGIVTSIYDREFPSAWVLFSELARLKVGLPIEAFHGQGELSLENAELLKSLGLKLTIRLLADPARSYAMKPLSIYRSSFQEVMWLDMDNFPLRDPSFLFDDPEYVAKGSLFWRDMSGTDRAAWWHPGARVWSAFNVPPNDSEEFESGQLLINKERCWAELGLTLHFNSRQDVYGTIIPGDKDLFRLAWQNLAAARKKAPPQAGYLENVKMVPYGFMPFGPFSMGRANTMHKWGGGTVMVQRDREGAALFIHRHIDKFALDRDNPFNADVPNEATHHDHVARLRELLGSKARARARDPV